MKMREQSAPRDFAKMLLGKSADWPIRTARSEGLGGLNRRETFPQLGQSTKATWVAKKASTRSNRGFFTAKVPNKSYYSGG
jgi:hypothetical protein